MDRVAVFVDAGYLFAAGSILLSGERHPRGRLLLDTPGVVRFLIDFATRVSDLPLLRVYWYDGTSSGPTTEHRTLAHSPNVKVRLGFVNTQGEQKGVDSLIVTDMISLARNQAMTDAVLLTGDEDIRVGVQQAQELGVRVHLVGIAPHRDSQSDLLMQEADVVHELDRETVSGFLAVRPAEVVVHVAPSEDESTPSDQRVAEAVWAALSSSDRATLVQQIGSGSNSVPGDIDRQLLRTASQSRGGRSLQPEEKRALREAFKSVVRSNPSPSEGA